MKLTLRAKRFDSSPGPNGGSLAEALWIEIYEVKKKGEKRVYGGPALGMNDEAREAVTGRRSQVPDRGQAPRNRGQLASGRDDQLRAQVAGEAGLS